MKALDDLRATVRTDNDGLTMITTRAHGQTRSVAYTRDEAMQLIGALALSIRHPLMTFNVEWSERAAGTTMGELHARTGEPKRVSERPVNDTGERLSEKSMRASFDIMKREPSPYLKGKDKK